MEDIGTALTETYPNQRGDFTYLWQATKSSSFLTPLRFSAPSLTKKERQCKRSSAGTPLNLQYNADLNSIAQPQKILSCQQHVCNKRDYIVSPLWKIMYTMFSSTTASHHVRWSDTGFGVSNSS